MDWSALPPLTALRAFAALAECGSAVAAGERLNVSHAAISQQIKALEAHMGLRLVDRAGRALTLTPEGRQLADALEAGFGTILRAVEALTGADADRPLQVTTTPGFAAQWLMPRLLDFRMRHPDVDVMINPTPERVALEPGGIDVAIRFGTGDWPGVETELLLRAGLVVVAAPALIGEREITDPAQLADLPWIQELGTTESTDWLRRKGLKSRRNAGVTHVPGNLLLEGARQGQGVVLTVRQWVEHDLAAGRLRLLFEEPGETGYFIVTRPGVRRPVLKSFLRWLREAARRDVGLSSLDRVRQDDLVR